MHELPIDLVAEKRNFESVAVGDAKLFAYDHAPCRQLLLLYLNQGLGFHSYVLGFRVWNLWVHTVGLGLISGD